MRKFLFNGAMFGIIVGAFAAAKTSKTGPRDWRLALTWASWGLSLIVAVATVFKESSDSKKHLS